MMNQVASQTEIGKICSKLSPCSAARLSQPADTPSAALSHGQDPYPTSPLRHPSHTHALKDTLAPGKVGRIVAE